MKSIWIKTCWGADSDQAMDIELDNLGGLYISGLFSGAANFDGNTVTAIQPSANSISMSIIFWSNTIHLVIFNGLKLEQQLIMILTITLMDIITTPLIIMEKVK